MEIVDVKRCTGDEIEWTVRGVKKDEYETRVRVEAFHSSRLPYEAQVKIISAECGDVTFCVKGGSITDTKVFDAALRPLSKAREEIFNKIVLEPLSTFDCAEPYFLMDPRRMYQTLDAKRDRMYENKTVLALQRIISAEGRFGHSGGRD